MQTTAQHELDTLSAAFETPPSYSPDPSGQLPEAATEQYERDGVVCLRGVLTAERIEDLRHDTDRAVDDPAPGEMHHRIGGTPEDPGFFFFEYQMHQRFASFRSLLEDPPIPEYAMALMRSSMLGFFYMNTFVKESGSRGKPTPWHQDGSYSRMLGDKVINFYLPLNAMPAETTLRFKQGSHREGVTYLPEGGEWEGVASKPVTRGKVPMPPFREIDEAYPTIGWALEPGDALVFQQRVLHGAPGNPFPHRRRSIALVLCGDDVRYDAAPGTNDPPFEDPSLADGDIPWGDVFPRIR